MRPKNPAQPPAQLDVDEGDILHLDQRMARIAFGAGPYPLPWGSLRTWGPHPRCRWDPHPLPAGEHPCSGVLYTGEDLATCVAEVFADTRIVDVHSDAPYLLVWQPTRALRLLDMTGTWALRNGASASLDSAPRSTCRAWARAIATARPDLDGLRVRSTMTGRPMTVLFAPARDAFPELPQASAPLADATIHALLAHMVASIGYALP